MKGVMILVLTAIIFVCFSMPKSKHFLVETEADNWNNKNVENMDGNEDNRDYRMKFEEHKHEKKRGNKVETK